MKDEKGKTVTPSPSPSPFLNPSNYPVSDTGFEKAVSDLSKETEVTLGSDDTAPIPANPYNLPRPKEGTASAKKRYSYASRFETARIAEVKARKVGSGTAGFSGRGISVYEGLRSFVASNPPEAPLTLKAIIALSEKAYVSANPGRKLSPTGAEVYSAYTLDVYRLAGLIAFDPKSETYRLAPEFRARLLSKPSRD
jgi:hypothetical protein